VPFTPPVALLRKLLARLELAQVLDLEPLEKALQFLLK
jgi:hypothetical protein